MAASNIRDWSSIPSGRDNLSKAVISSSNFVSFLTYTRSNRRFFLVNSSSSSSHIEHAQIKLREKENLNEFICGLCKDRKTEALAFEYYQKAKNEPEFRPEEITIKLLIRYFLRCQQWRLIGSCIRARKFKLAEMLVGIIESDEEKAVWAFESAMKSYNKLHMYSSTILVYNRMKSAGVLPDPCCYCRIMEAYRKTGDTKMVLFLFREFESLKLESSPYSNQIYGILCDSLGKSGQAFEALGFFRDMIEKGIVADSSMYSSLICAFASLREVKMAEELFKEAREKQLVKDPALFLKLVLMYIDEGSVEKTLEIVRVMQAAKLKVSDCIFCTIINGYSKKRRLTKTVEVYEELISSGCEPGQVTFASIISVYCRLGLYDEAESVFSEMEGKGFVKCVVAYSSMVAMYGKVGRLRDAMRLVAKMKERGCEPNVWIYNSLMDMHGRVKNLRQVEKLWKEMKRRKVAPDKVSYTSVINAYSKAREFDACLKFYEEFRINGGAIDRVMAGIMVGVYSKSSRIDELVKLLQDLKSEGIALDVRLHRSAMNALRDAGFQMKWFDQSFSPNSTKSRLGGSQPTNQLQKQQPGEYRPRFP